MTPLYRLLTELAAHKTVSRMAGSFAKSRFSRKLIPLFVKAYGIDTSESEKRPEEYESLNAFFIRRLKPGVRPVDPDPAALVSPVDARVVALGSAKEGVIPEVKGQDYPLEELLRHSPRVVHYRDGFYIVLYLAPSDYHRIHAPATGECVETEHVPGRTYPVNDSGMRRIPRVLNRNERLITYIRHPFGELALVKVGALNVSGIRYVDGKPGSVRAGDELAYFEFGSTVVVLTETGTFTPRPDLAAGRKVRVGERLGTLHLPTKASDKRGDPTFS